MKELDGYRPIDKNAASIIKPAKPEDVWMPEVKPQDHVAHSKNVLPTRPIPRSAAHMEAVLSKRRDRMVVVGYAKHQNPKAPGKWVVRCDCGNFEHRTKILRWLGTEGPDECQECRLRYWKIHGRSRSLDTPAERKVLQLPSVSPRK